MESSRAVAWGLASHRPRAVDGGGKSCRAIGAIGAIVALAMLGPRLSDACNTVRPSCSTRVRNHDGCQPRVFSWERTTADAEVHKQTVILGIDADPIGRSGSGNETYLRGIISGLLEVQNGPELIVAGTSTDELRTVVGHRAKVVGLHSGLIGDLLLGQALRKAGADVVLAHYNAPIGFRGPVATVIHDVAFLRYPATFPFALRARIGWSVRRSVRLSALVVTGSEFSRSELLSYYPDLDPSRVVVTPYAARVLPALTPNEADAVRTRLRLPKRFVLVVGNLQPRKNLGRLVAATTAAGVPLVVVGQALWKSNDVLQQFDGKDVHWVGRLSDADLAALYATCTVFAYPSLYEGYGLPVVEAMAAGAPVVTSNVSSLPEVAGDAAVLVDPLDVLSITAGLTHLLESETERADYRERGLARAASFTWVASARTLLEALNTLIP